MDKDKITQYIINMISILMPIYNGIEFIDESVGSVIDQQMPEWELIIAINGHPENSREFQIAKRWANKHPDKIHVYDMHTVKGKANTLNAMIPHCQFEYVAILDVDDIWHPFKLMAQMPYINQYDVIGTRCVYFGDREGIIPSIPLGDIGNYTMTNLNPIINSSAIIRKTLCYWNEEYAGVEDYDLWLRLWQQNRSFYNCEEVVVKHRIHTTSAFNAKGNHNLVDIMKQQYIDK